MKMFELLVSAISLYTKKETVAREGVRSLVFGGAAIQAAVRFEILLTNLVADSLERCWIVHGEVSENLAVDFHTCFVDEAHKLAVRQPFKTGCSVDTLDPESTEIALFLLAVAVGVGETLLPCILRYGPHITAAAIVATGEFKDFLAFCS